MPTPDDEDDKQLHTEEIETVSGGRRDEESRERDDDETVAISIHGNSLSVPLSRFARHALVGLIAVIVCFGLVSAGRYFNVWPFDGGEIRISKMDLEQLAMARAVLGETPTVNLEVANNERGIWRVLHYRSNDSVFVSRIPSDQNRARIGRFIKDVEIPTPESFADLSGFLSAPAYAVTDRTDVAYGVEHEIQMQSGGGGGCHDLSDGARNEWPEEFGDQCWIRVWREWPDGCKHHQGFNRCGGYWDVNEDGSPRVVWVRCVH